jgi:signal peptidase
MAIKVAKWIAAVTLVLLLATTLFVVVAPRFGWRIEPVRSGSMAPALKTGGVVVVKPVNPATIKVGDIITFRSSGANPLITHRVIEMQGDPPVFRTKGDANEEADTYIVPAQSVVGRVVFYVPYFGYFASFVKSRIGFFALLLGTGSILIGWEMRNLWSALSEMEKAKKG